MNRASSIPSPGPSSARWPRGNEASAGYKAVFSSFNAANARRTGTLSTASIDERRAFAGVRRGIAALAVEQAVERVEPSA